MQSRNKAVVLTLFAASLAACGDSSGPDNGDVRVYMSRSAALTAQTTTDNGSSGLFMGSVPLSAVDSINVTLTAIEAINANDSTGYVSIPLQGTGTHSVNLLKLGTLGSDSTMLARGELIAGTYNNIRLRFDTATIVLNQTVTVGNVTYAAGTYSLTVPSGLSSGIKVQGATFTVSEDATTSVTLSFDAATSVGNIVATGSNKLMMSPVMHVRTHVDD